MSDDILDALEKGMDNNTPPIAGGDKDDRVDTVFFHGSLKAQALKGLPAEWREKLIEAGGKIGITGDDDIAWLLVGSVVDSAAAAFSAGEAAQLVHNEIRDLPHVIQNAAIAAANDIDGTIKKSFEFNIDAFEKVLSGAINAGTKRPLDMITGKIGESVKSLNDAVAGIDREMNQQIIAKRETVLAGWVQSGSDELNDKVREAVRQQRIINLEVMLAIIFITFVFGMFIGYLISTHVVL